MRKRDSSGWLSPHTLAQGRQANNVRPQELIAETILEIVKNPVDLTVIVSLGRRLEGTMSRKEVLNSIARSLEGFAKGFA
jgi:hypothetical protein